MPTQKSTETHEEVAEEKEVSDQESEEITSAQKKFGIESIPDRYEPWEDEGVFHFAYSIVQGWATVVDIIRCWELWDLVHQTAHLEGALLEVGCWNGGSGGIIGLAAKKAGIRDTTFLCDTFSGTVKGNNVDAGYVDDGAFSSASKKLVERVLFGLQVSNYKILEGIFPEETGYLLGDSRIRFCHIDVDTYQSAADTYEWVWPRLVVGGILVYDDYGYLVTPGISKHVNEIRHGEDRISMYNLNEHAVLIKTK